MGRFVCVLFVLRNVIFERQLLKSQVVYILVNECQYRVGEEGL